jgi:hypothetical protein
MSILQKVGRWEGKISVKHNSDRLLLRKVEEIGSGSCPMAGFGISSVELSGSVTRILVVSLLIGSFRAYVLIQRTTRVSLLGLV